ncbi:glutamate-5-semialdehyde dehydrogenase [Paenibacillus sp. ACRRX]|uniref:glutamate-5-semialdehyde dehydrogenase n=1 Tax=Paenibacillus sp. ACRRX TaxID=2918206 RepID=UPI001EF4E1CF|nr:glutamate-5-semialdehyde dehydrogenase [Paenibacillus sp. ACRRX]MCG7406669.1 glutamate-5-semialdehyde dehydrogenase [Paenibacillus sp. ACRRX]
MSEVRSKAKLAKQAAIVMNKLTTEQKNEALLHMAHKLIVSQESIIAANMLDLERGRQAGTSESLLDRLALTEARIDDIAEGLRQIAALPDPVGDVLATFDRPNGLHVEHIRVPLGVIGMIYEARPNVTVDAAGLCLKTGNAVLLRGGSAALSTNKRIVEVLHEALLDTAIPVEALQIIEDPNRASVDEMLTLNGLLDVVIPRGGASLIQNVVQNATVPVIETGAGVCHTFIDASAQPDMATEIAWNAKVQRPSVCNSMETLLVHRQYDLEQIKLLLARYHENGVRIYGCSYTNEIAPFAEQATEQSYSTEYSDFTLNVKFVHDLDEALQHIARHSTMHSECIVTENEHHAARFLQEVDAAAVYHNASTRFTDGFEFGYGAEIGISTQKLHARGPMGLPALTSSKYRVYGTGQIRG